MSRVCCSLVYVAANEFVLEAVVTLWFLCLLQVLESLWVALILSKVNQLFSLLCILLWSLQAVFLGHNFIERVRLQVKDIRELHI